uniref:MND1-interacting protein 1 n=1 Tax=Aegilops tauschii TaxID=37682 RepID=M8B739_AEGTA
MAPPSTDKSPPRGFSTAESDAPPPAAPAPGQRGYCHFHATTATENHMFDPETFMRLAMRAHTDSTRPHTESTAGVVSCVKNTWSRSGGSAAPAPAAPDGQGQPKQSFAMKVSTDDLIESVVMELESLDIDKKDPPAEKPDPKNEMVRDLIKQTREMEEQLKERKEWAQKKAVQAARKLGNDLTELRMLRMEHDDNQRRKNDKQSLEDETMKRLTRLEYELKKKSGQLDRSNASVQKLEMENAEIRAEMEAAKLSASETERQCQILLKKEKKDSKKLELWERQKAKLQEEIAECKAKIAQADKELAGVNKSIRNMELPASAFIHNFPDCQVRSTVVKFSFKAVKIREDTKATEDNLALAEQERGKRESAKADADRRLEEIRRKTEVESQCYKDDLRRLQDQLSRLQKSMGANAPTVPSAYPPAMTDRNAAGAPKQPNQKAPPASNRQQEPIQNTGRRRGCIICKREEACVMLLQCAHQVLCVGCNKQHEEKGAVRCPSCNAKIEERIRVFDVLDVLAGGETLVEISRAGLSLLSMVTVKQVEDVPMRVVLAKFQLVRTYEELMAKKTKLIKIMQPRAKTPRPLPPTLLVIRYVDDIRAGATGPVVIGGRAKRRCLLVVLLRCEGLLKLHVCLVEDAAVRLDLRLGLDGVEDDPLFCRLLHLGELELRKCVHRPEFGLLRRRCLILLLLLRDHHLRPISFCSAHTFSCSGASTFSCSDTSSFGLSGDDLAADHDGVDIGGPQIQSGIERVGGNGSAYMTDENETGLGLRHRLT